MMIKSILAMMVAGESLWRATNNVAVCMTVEQLFSGVVGGCDGDWVVGKVRF